MIRDISKKDFLELVYNDTDSFMGSIDKNEVYVVKNFYSREMIEGFLAFIREFRKTQEPSWHPCLDGCPDYHRINDEYEKSYVRARMHSYYFHRWNSNREFFENFREIFDMKNYLAGKPKNSYYDTIPSDGIISRIVTHQYPRGGGYLKEHVDPTSIFAKIQTLIIAATYGKDFKKGGVYLHEEGKEPVYLDPHTGVGDLLVLSPGVRHGVAAIDPEEALDWAKEDGRWMILPIIIRSDYNMDPATKPKEVQ